MCYTLCSCMQDLWRTKCSCNLVDFWIFKQFCKWLFFVLKDFLENFAPFFSLFCHVTLVLGETWLLRTFFDALRCMKPTSYKNLVEWWCSKTILTSNPILNEALKRKREGRLPCNKRRSNELKSWRDETRVGKWRSNQLYATREFHPTLHSRGYSTKKSNTLLKVRFPLGSISSGGTNQVTEFDF